MNFQKKTQAIKSMSMSVHNEVFKFPSQNLFIWSSPKEGTGLTRPQSKEWLDQPLEVGWDLNIIMKISCVLTKVYLPSAKTELIQKNCIDKVFFNCGSQVIMTKVKDGKR